MADSQNTEARGKRKERMGTVLRRSSDKSLVVVVERRSPHPMYGKVVRQLKKYHVHDEKNEGRVGDTVRIVETRPMSRTKKWRLLEVAKKSAQSGGEAAS